MKIFPLYFLLLMALFTSNTAAASTLPTASSALPPSTGTIIEQEPDFLPVEQAYQVIPSFEGTTLTLDWVIAEGYYLYQDKFNVSVLANNGNTHKLPLTFESGLSRYDDYYEKTMEVYYKQTTVTSTLDSDVPASAVVTVKVQSQACADAGLCYPPRSQFLSIDVYSNEVGFLEKGPAKATKINQPNNEPGMGITMAIAFALIGGVLLNLMPCVFPVLSIKVLSLTSSHLSHHKRHLHGLSYTAGVVATFVTVAASLIFLRQGGKALGWGFQLQSPGFITTLIFLFFLMGLSFSGFYQPGARLMNLGQRTSSGSTLHHSFLTGILATLVASPCSAPFMGTALGYALTQTSLVAMAIFIALGIGMALPFLLLTWSPALMKHLPKPGQWMNTLKELLAFPLYLTCLWLLWILGNQTSEDTLVSVLAGLVILAFAVWLANKAQSIGKIVAVLIALSGIAIPFSQLSDTPDTKIWQPYSEQRLQNLLLQKRAVFVNLTADWCITCLANEKFALDTDHFSQALKDYDITYLKGDWTNYDPEITRLLNRNGRSGVPLYLYYREGKEQPEILPQILSRSSATNLLKPK